MNTSPFDPNFAHLEIDLDEPDDFREAPPKREVFTVQTSPSPQSVKTLVPKTEELVLVLTNSDESARRVALILEEETHRFDRKKTETMPPEKTPAPAPKTSPSSQKPEPATSIHIPDLDTQPTHVITPRNSTEKSPLTGLMSPEERRKKRDEIAALLKSRR